jgi:large subunit ribosomal protein L5
MNRLKQQINESIIPALQKELGLKNQMSVPKIEKVVINCGLTEEAHQQEALKSMAEQLKLIAGQKPKICSARQSIAGFHLRAGDPIGLKVTLRGERMFQFLDKLISVALPRVKDFQGVPSTAFDRQGNYSLGLNEQIVFPEINYDKIDRVRGLQIIIVTTAKEPKTAKRLLELIGMPFQKTTEIHN